SADDVAHGVGCVEGVGRHQVLREGRAGFAPGRCPMKMGAILASPPSPSGQPIQCPIDSRQDPPCRQRAGPGSDLHVIQGNSMSSHAIRVGIAGYGNRGRGAVAALARCPDMRLAGVFTRRAPASLRLPDPATPVLPLNDAAAHRHDIDVMILCGGSKDDLPVQGPELAQWFTTVDSYDTHARIPRYFEAVDAAARAHGNLSIIAVGWDPGLFSISRLVGEAILPD